VPRVSVGVTVYNSERYLDECLQSLLSQTFEDFEIIISDNASTDRTQEIALGYVARDPRVKYVRNRFNIGVGGNFNQTFRLSSGEFFKWAAYDDVCEKDMLLRCVEVLDADPGVVLAHPRVVGIDEHGRTMFTRGPGPDLTSPDPAVRFSKIMEVPFWATSLFGMVRADVMAESGLMPSNAAGDHVLLAELSLRGRFHAISEEGVFNRDHPGRAYTKSSIIRRAQQVDPTLGQSPLMLRLRQIASYLAVIRRTPLSRAARARCYVSVTRWLCSRIVARTLAGHANEVQDKRSETSCGTAAPGKDVRRTERPSQ
jgi:glycosyltransferase involved in cell wall biosynthesis